MSTSPQRAELHKTRAQIETDLLKIVEERQRAWLAATPENRSAARQQFLDALRTLNDLVLDGKAPENHAD